MEATKMVEQIAKLRKKTKKSIDHLVETKKVVIMTNVRSIIEKLLKVMKSHIGEKNKISRNQLFKKIYGISVEDVSDLQEWMLFQLLKISLNSCRRNTKCFVVSKQFSLSSMSKGGIWHYWVATTYSDYECYHANIERNIKAMRNMEQKCLRSIKNKWYKEQWTY
jgi:hypothetical protein